jgi:molecular chaperone GrpE
VRKIGQREVENAKQFGHQNLAADLLQVADFFGHCLAGVPKEELEVNKQLRILYEGLQMTEGELQKAFKKHNIQKFNPLGEPFDPNRMNALFQMPHDPSKPGNTVGNVVKPGYMIGNRVLRPADVGVLRHKDESEQKQEANA